MHYNTHSCLLYERYIVPMAHIWAVLFIYSTQDTMRIPIDDWRNTKKKKREPDDSRTYQRRNR